MLYEWVREFVSKYSFLTKVERKLLYVYFYYEKDGKEKFEKLSFRANRNHVIKMIEKIKIDIDYDEQKKKRDMIVRKKIKDEHIMYSM